MSHLKSGMVGKTGARIRNGSLIILGIGVLLFVASAIIPASGAYFFDNRDGTMTTGTASFGMSVSKTNGANLASVNLEFKDLAPGKTVADAFTVKNTGSITGVLTLRADSVDFGGVSPASFGYLTYTVNGRDNLSPTSGATINAGTIPSGESKTVSIAASLGNAAGNEWQGKTVTNALHVTLSQEP